MESLLGNLRKEKLSVYIKLSNYLSGNLAEVGVYKGGSAEIIAKAKEESKKLFLFDTFEGMPEVNEKDNFCKKGDFNDTSYDSVKQGLQNYKNIFLYKGIFPKENSEHIEKEQFSLVHIDVDIYQSYKDCLEFFYPRMVCGGIIVLDDYNHDLCHGAKLATDEFLKDKNEKVIWHMFSQACIIKQAM